MLTAGTADWGRIVIHRDTKNRPTLWAHVAAPTAVNVSRLSHVMILNQSRHGLQACPFLDWILVFEKFQGHAESLLKSVARDPTGRAEFVGAGARMPDVTSAFGGIEDL